MIKLHFFNLEPKTTLLQPQTTPPKKRVNLEQNQNKQIHVFVQQKTLQWKNKTKMQTFQSKTYLEPKQKHYTFFQVKTPNKKNNFNLDLTQAPTTP